MHACFRAGAAGLFPDCMDNKIEFQSTQVCFEEKPYHSNLAVIQENETFSWRETEQRLLDLFPSGIVASCTIYRYGGSTFVYCTVSSLNQYKHTYIDQLDLYARMPQYQSDSSSDRAAIPYILSVFARQLGIC